MKNFKLLLFMIACFVPFWMGAKQVSEETARQVAEAQVRSISQLRSAQSPTFSLVYTKTTASKEGSTQMKASSSVSTDVLYYVYNVGNQGFVIISGDDVAVPVLGYSDNGVYDSGNLPPSFVYWMDCLANEIKEAITNNLTQSEKAKGQWESFLNENYTALRASNAVVVTPLIKTKWNQGDPYNKLCPASTSLSLTAVTGCVATAMAQIMKYHQCPDQGTGSSSAYTTTRYGLSVPAVNFSQTTYDWGNMTNTYSSTSTELQKNAVATLMYHCGVSVNMDYCFGPPKDGGSGASSGAVVSALVNYFKYDAGINYLERNYYQYTQWLGLIKNELDASRPVFYSGHGSDGGHAFVCDGYDSDDLFHFNWGWGGSSDGYFELSALNPAFLGIGGGAGGFNMDQSIIVGIQPNAGGTASGSPRLGLLNIYPSTGSLNSLSESFGVTIDTLKNIGATIFSSPLRLGFELCEDNGTQINYRNTNNYGLANTFIPGSYFQSLNLTNCFLPNTLPPGRYKLFGVFFMQADPYTPIKIEGVNGEKYIQITVNGDNTVTLTTASDIKPDLKLVSLVPVGNLYTNSTGNFTATIQNNGNGDYNSNMTLALNGSALATDPVVIPAGTTKEVGFSGNINLSPGTYPLTLWYDPNNNQGTPSLQFASSNNVTVNPTPAPAILSVTSCSFPNSNAVSPNTPNLSISIQNTGGECDKNIFAFIFQYPEGGNSVSYFGQKNVSIEQGETTILFNDPVSLDPGTYFCCIYYLSDDGKSYIQIPPSNAYVFTIVYSTDASLSNLTVSEGSLSPVFNSNTTDYTVDVANSVSNITITGTPTDENATVNGNGTKSLAVGANPFTIAVTAEDGTTVKRYNVTVNRAGSGNSVWTPLAASPNKWNDPANWTPNGVPGATAKVTIPKSSSYPIVDAPTTVAEIHFEPEAQLGGQSNLTSDVKAFVSYDFSSTQRNRWLMLSMPLNEAYPADFGFGGYPLTWVETFQSKAVGNKTNGTWVNGRGSQVPFRYGDGFVLWLNSDVEGKGLNLLPNDFRELPFFQHNVASDPTERALYESVDEAHEYDGSTKESTFYNLTKDNNGQYVLIKDAAYSYKVPRTDAAFQLAGIAGSEVSKTIDFAGGDFALIGNPYMATFDFSKLYESNSDFINSSYYIWTGNGYSIYNSLTQTATGVLVTPSLTQYIPPLQGFIVAKNSGSSGSGTLKFSESMTTTAEPVALRLSTRDENILGIVASASVAKFRTVIAKRNGGQDDLCDLDVRMITNGISNVPQVYTLKPYNGSSVAAAVNIINNDDLLIPVGLATNYTGNITLSFTGMDTYDANLYLIDAVANKEINLTGLTSCDYTINYTPPKVNNAVTACEDRFFIRISKTVTGMLNTVAGRVNVYESNSHIQVVSDASNLLKEVDVYNLQGALIYKKTAIHTISHTVDRIIPAGIYIVKAVSEKNNDNVKIIIK